LITIAAEYPGIIIPKDEDVDMDSCRKIMKRAKTMEILLEKRDILDDGAKILLEKEKYEFIKI